MMPTTRAADILNAGDSGNLRYAPRHWPGSEMARIAAGVVIFSLALLMTLLPDRGAEETNQLFETATSTELAGGIDYVMRLRFADGVPYARRRSIVAQLDGAVTWSVNDRGDYEIHVRLDDPSFQVLQEYEARATEITGVQSAKFTALQLPMR